MHAEGYKSGRARASNGVRLRGKGRDSFPGEAIGWRGEESQRPRECTLQASNQGSTSQPQHDSYFRLDHSLSWWLWDVEQHPWPLITRYQEQSPPTCDNQKWSPDGAKCPPLPHLRGGTKLALGILNYEQHHLIRAKGAVF